MRDAFRARGHDAWSCDLLPCEADPKYHIQGDVLPHLNDGWDLMIAHPPCTYLCAGGVNWINRKPEWRPNRDAAVEFVNTLLKAPIGKIALENPIGYLSTAIRKPDIIVRAWQFGEPFKKDICLWLKGLPPLVPTNVKGSDMFSAAAHDNPKTYDFWSSKRFLPSGANRKSITFLGIAKAMAEQWG